MVGPIQEGGANQGVRFVAFCRGVMLYAGSLSLLVT